MTAETCDVAIVGAGPAGIGAAVLLAEECVFGVELDGTGLRVQTSDYGQFTRRLPGVVQGAGIRLFELRPTDDSLESVFAYLVGR